MKFKPTDKAVGLVVELGPREMQLPPDTVAKSVGSPPGFKLKRILVPVDFSSCSKKALEYAIPFAEQFCAELTLLHVLQSYTPMLEIAIVHLETVEDANQELEKLRQIIPETVRSNSALRRGEPHQEIVGVAKELDIDLIILSTHGRSGLTQLVIGGTAERVVRHAGCPVLVVREHEHEFISCNAVSLAQKTGKENE
jgi:universal stress protein A